jgi:hypothetical protein
MPVHPGATHPVAGDTIDESIQLINEAVSAAPAVEGNPVAADIPNQATPEKQS